MKPWVEQGLRDLGYLAGQLVSDAAIDLAVGMFQEFHGIRSDGVAGPVTERTLADRMSFCRVPDNIKDGNGRCKWPSNLVTWAFRSMIPELSDKQESLTARAFAAWAAVSGLEPKQAAKWQDANIVIGGGRGRRSNFDGPSGTLAWAYLPCGSQRSVDLKFDLDERWAGDEAGRGRILYYNVAVHEIGHALGIPHIQVGSETNIMAPVYSPRVKDLGPTDIKSIQIRYGDEKAKPDPRPPDGPPGGREVELFIDGKRVFPGS